MWISWLSGDICLSGRLEKQRKSSYVWLKEEAEELKGKRKQRRGEKGRRESEYVDKEADVQSKREVECLTSEVSVIVKCLLSSALSLCCPHGVLASACKRSRSDTWSVCVSVDIAWCRDELHSCVRPQGAATHYHAHVRRASSVPVGPPSIHPSIHPQHPTSFSFALLLCRFSKGGMGVNTDKQGLFSVTDGNEDAPCVF